MATILDFFDMAMTQSEEEMRSEILRTTNQPEAPTDESQPPDSPSYEERIDALAGAVRRTNWKVLTTPAFCPNCKQFSTICGYNVEHDICPVYEQARSEQE